MHQPDGGAVLRRDVHQIVHRLDAAGARHILHQNLRLAGNMVGVNGSEGMRVAGITAARTGAQDPGDLLVLVEIRNRVGPGRG